jgi:hypothetical protein
MPLRWSLKDLSDIFHKDFAPDGALNAGLGTVPDLYLSTDFNAARHRSFSGGVPMEMRVHSGS